MDAHPTPFPENKAQPVKSKNRKISQPPKQKTKEIAPPMHRRTFGVIRDPNIPEKTIPQKPKAKPSNQIPPKQTKSESANKTTQNVTGDKERIRKKKKVSFPEKIEGSVTKKSPAREGDAAKTPVRPPFSAKPVRVPGTPYLSAEKCSDCRFDRLETSSYWLGQIKSAEAVGKHFVSATFFRLALDCKAEPARNIQKELKKYLVRHDCLSTKAEWEHVSSIYGILKNEQETRSDEETKVGDVQEGLCDMNKKQNLSD